MLVEIFDWYLLKLVILTVRDADWQIRQLVEQISEPYHGRVKLQATRSDNSKKRHSTRAGLQQRIPLHVKGSGSQTGS